MNRVSRLMALIFMDQMMNNVRRFLWMSAAVAAMSCCVADEAPKAPEKEESPAQSAIRELAKECVFRPAAEAGGSLDPFVLGPEPLLKYGDPTRDIGSSALWVWMDGEVPAIFQKIEVNVHQGSNNKWTWCFANAGSRKLECAWPKARPGLVTVDEVMTSEIPKSPLVKESAPTSALAFTARQLSRKFTARDGDDELRLLPRPLMQFQSDGQGIPYGAVFGFATGTNPSVLLIVQAEKKGQDVKWTYRPLHMTALTVELEYDGEKLWQEAGQPQNEVSTWGYFFSFREASIK